jgi:hypothetical protein
MYGMDDRDNNIFGVVLGNKSAAFKEHASSDSLVQPSYTM